MKKRYVQVGLGGRSGFFWRPIVSTYKETSELVGFCDLNQTRMDYANKILKEEYNHAPVPTYSIDKFDDMVREQKADVVLVTSVDRTHHKYIVRAMELFIWMQSMRTDIFGIKVYLVTESVLKTLWEFW